MPTSDVGLEAGTLYRIGNDVKISLLNIAGTDGVSATNSVGTVTVAVS
jgi:nicotinamide mononucleotide (NMN) deamidase PncC